MGHIARSSDATRRRRHTSLGCVAVLLNVQGVWHAAGVLADAVLPTASATGLAHALRAQGTWRVEPACGGVATRCARSPLFSSVAALLGGAGQANYAAANACLDALATMPPCARHALRSVCSGGRGQRWGWRRAVRRASGWRRWRRHRALRASAWRRAWRRWAWRYVVVGLACWGWCQWCGAASWAPKCPPSSRRLRHQGHRRAVHSRLGGTAMSAGSAVCRSRSVLEMAKRTAGGSVDADAPLMEAGVDSLGAVELRNSLQSAAGSGQVAAEHARLRPPDGAPARVDASAGAACKRKHGGHLPGSSPSRCLRIYRRHECVPPVGRVVASHGKLLGAVWR